MSTATTQPLSVSIPDITQSSHNNTSSSADNNNTYQYPINTQSSPLFTYNTNYTHSTDNNKNTSQYYTTSPNITSTNSYTSSTPLSLPVLPSQQQQSTVNISNNNANVNNNSQLQSNNTASQLPPLPQVQQQQQGQQNVDQQQQQGQQGQQQQGGVSMDPAMVLMNLKPRGQKHPKHFWCELCNKGFTQKGSLAKHRLTHTGEKPFRCNAPGCSRAFAQSGNLARHMRSHSDEKLFACSYCNKQFRRKDTVRQHELIHTVPHNSNIQLNQQQQQQQQPQLNITNTSNAQNAADQNNNADGVNESILDIQQTSDISNTNAAITDSSINTTNNSSGGAGQLYLTAPVSTQHINALSNNNNNNIDVVSYGDTGVKPDISNSALNIPSLPTINTTNIIDNSNSTSNKRSRSSSNKDTFIIKKEKTDKQRTAKDIQPVAQWSYLDENEGFELVSENELAQYESMISNELTGNANTLNTTDTTNNNDNNTPATPTSTSTTEQQSTTAANRGIPSHKLPSRYRPYRCKQCNKGFKSRGAVTFHMRIHLNERPFKCDIDNCDKSFKQKSNLLQHISSVHECNKPYTCTLCQRQFKTKFSAQEHERRNRCKANKVQQQTNTPILPSIQNNTGLTADNNANYNNIGSNDIQLNQQHNGNSTNYDSSNQQYNSSNSFNTSNQSSNYNSNYNTYLPSNATQSSNTISTSALSPSTQYNTHLQQTRQQVNGVSNNNNGTVSQTSEITTQQQQQPATQSHNKQQPEATSLLMQLHNNTDQQQQSSTATNQQPTVQSTTPQQTS